MLISQTLAQLLQLPNGSVLNNRLAKAAMSETLGTIDNHPTLKLAALYKRLSSGGVGLCITGNVMIDRRALGEPNNVVIEDTSHLGLLQGWAEAGSINGTQLWMQINHPGKQAPSGLNEETVAPSAIPFRADMARFFNTPRALQDKEIEEIILRFGRTAYIAKLAGFKGVQIHAAHGYLISQFLSPYHNRRTDHWGGNVTNRHRFMLGVIQEIRHQVGKDFPVGIKLNSADFQRGGFTEAESITAIQALERAGIDLIEVSGGTYEMPAMVGAKALKQSTQQREAYFFTFAKKARMATRVPLMLTGGFRTAAGMANAIASGAVDLIGLARPLAVEPNLPKRLLMGCNGKHAVKPITTGIKVLDKISFLEIKWYTYQLKRMGMGKNPKPNASPLILALINLIQYCWRRLKNIF